MKTLLKSLLVAGVMGIALFSSPSTSQAQDPYWRNHWGWYDNTYRPYYNNYYYSSPGYYSGYRGYYGGPYYNGYYSTPYYGPGVGVHVGRLNFGWW